MWITPNYQDTDFSWPLTLDDKITIFFDRTYGWQLDIADRCISGIPHSGFAVLHIIISYFEMIAKYQEGFTRKGKSEYYFRQGVYSVFPQLKKIALQTVDSLLEALYYGCRCGLYHGGMTDYRIIITGEDQFPMVFDPQENRLKINPHLLVPALKCHLGDYEKQIREQNNALLRRKFERRFDYDALKSLASPTEYYSTGGPSFLPDVLKQGLKVVFCGLSGSKSAQAGMYYVDSRNIFWAVLFRTGLIPRALSPDDFRILPKYSIGLTELRLKIPKKGYSQTPVEYDIPGLRDKIERFSPTALAFNGKRPAQEFYGRSVTYGRQYDSIGLTTVFVLPSTAGVAQRYWNESHWQELAKFVK